jgi:hypothetical protein
VHFFYLAEVVAMKESFFKRVAKRILYLEINTIVKDDMDGTKMPSSNRRALYELAGRYDNELIKLDVRDPVYWKFGGMRSFGELRRRALKGIEIYKKRRETATESAQKSLDQKIGKLNRIEYQSSQVVGIFKNLERKVEEKARDKYQPAPDALSDEKERQLKDGERAAPDDGSMFWNNDIMPQKINQIDDLDLSPDQITQLHKAWDIGTEAIVLQTIVQIDGDVTTRMAESLSKKPNDIIFDIHNNSIVTATNFWCSLVDSISKMVGRTFASVLGK